jgi:hypothetical protein
MENMDVQKKWQSVVGALMLLGELAEKAPSQMAPMLTDLTPLMTSCLTDLKAQVRDQAKETMRKLLDTVQNKDIEKVLDDLVVNMMDPNKTEETVHKYAGIVFVQVVTAAALAAVTPLLKRGFQERKDALSRMCAKIVANMSKLVEEPAEVRPRACTRASSPSPPRPRASDPFFGALVAGAADSRSPRAIRTIRPRPPAAMLARRRSSSCRRSCRCSSTPRSTSPTPRRAPSARTPASRCSASRRRARRTRSRRPSTRPSSATSRRRRPSARTRSSSST